MKLNPLGVKWAAVLKTISEKVQWNIMKFINFDSNLTDLKDC